MTSSTGRHGERGMTTRALAAVGGLAAILTIVGLSGVGDAPAPLVDAQLMAEHFQAVRVDVFIGAAVGLVGAALLTGFGLTLALRLARAGEKGAALVVAAGLTAVVGYLLAIHVVYATLSYAVATTSADVTKGMFVATILAVPVFGLGVATLLVGAAIGCRRADVMPSWWLTATIGAGTLSTIAVFSYAKSGFFSPDVQQQVVTDILVAWLLTTSIASAVGRRHPGLDQPASRPFVPDASTGSRQQTRDVRRDVTSTEWSHGSSESD